MGLRRVFCLTLFVLLLAFPLAAAAQSQLLSVDIEQISVAMPQLKVYLNLNGQNDERIDEAGADAQFSAMLDGEKMDVVSAESFEQSGEGVAMIYLIDISKSLETADFEQIKAQLQSSIEAMGDSDTAAIITFGETVNVLCENTDSKQELSGIIAGLELTDLNTRFYDGVKKALDLARIQDESVPDRRVILAVTDGSDAYAGGSTRQEVLDNIKEDPVPIYALGIYKGSLSSDKQQALDSLGEFSRTSGGQYFQMGTMPFEDVFGSIDESIRSTQVLTVDCGLMRADGIMHELYIALETGGKKYEDNCQVLLNTNMKDTTLPVVTGVASGDAYSVAVTFSEDVTGADDIGNYKVFDEDGNRIQISNAQYTSDGGYTAQIQFDVELGGEYTIEISGIADKADTPNAMAAVQKTFLVDNILTEDAAAQTDDSEQEDDYTLYYIIGGAALLLIAIAVVLIIVLRKRKKRKAEAELAAMPQMDIPATQPLHIPQPAKTVAPAGKPVHFAVIDAHNKTQAIERSIVGSLVIGRARGCDLAFDDTEMSRKHCELTWEKGQMYLSDLNPTNTTIVNGVPIHDRIRLNNGDVLLIGQTELRVTWKEEQ